MVESKIDTPAQLRKSQFPGMRSLTRNSSYLLLGQLTVALAGFSFWALAARSESVSDIGIAASLVSTSALVAAISLFGANQGVVKFLPTSKDKKETLSLIVTVVGLSSLFLGTMAFTVLAITVPLTSDVYWYGSIFVLNSFTVSVNIVIDSAMLSYGKTSRNLVSYLIASSLCLIALPVLSSYGPAGIVAANTILYGGNLVLNVYALKRLNAISFRPSFQIPILKPYASFAGASYLSGIFWIAPVLCLPALTMTQLGEGVVGYLAIVITFFNALLMFPTSISQSLFAALSFSELNLGPQVKRAFRDTLLVTICACIALGLLSRWALGLFGEDYVKNGHLVLLLLIPSALVASANLVCNSILKSRAQLGTLLLVNFLGFTISISVWIFTLKPFGLMAVPIGLILGHTIMLSAHAIALRSLKR